MRAASRSSMRRLSPRSHHIAGRDSQVPLIHALINRCVEAFLLSASHDQLDSAVWKSARGVLGVEATNLFPRMSEAGRGR